MDQERCIEDDDSQSRSRSRSKRSQFGGYLKQGLAWGRSELEQALGLGQKPSVIPIIEGATMDAATRTVEIGWHPVAGFGGKWFAEKTGLGKMITQNINHYPDPTQHWAVLVGGYVHQLWMDEHLEVIYLNEELQREQWRTFEVGKTNFNDEALVLAGEMVIHNMRTKRPAYNLISNNCQNFATLMLDAIQVGGHREFGSTYAIYQRATGKGAIKDLFVVEEQTIQGEGEGEAGMQPPAPSAQHENAMHYAHQVMEENTTKLDSHHDHSHFS